MTHSWQEAARKAFLFLVGEDQLLDWGRSQVEGSPRVPGPSLPTTLSREAAQALQWVTPRSHTVPAAGLGAAL